MTRPVRRRRAHRSAGATAPQIITGARREIPTYDLISTEGLEQIEARSAQLLQEIGVRFVEDPESLRLFHEAGAEVQGDRVRFPPGLLQKALETAPKTFRQHARNPERTIDLGGKNVVFGPGYGMPFVSDLDGGRRYGTIRDFENLTKLVYISPWLHHSGGTTCEPTDLPVNKRHLDMVYAHLKWSDKPFMGSVTAPERAADSIEMTRLAFGADFVDQNCVIMANINMNSPLVFDYAMSGAIRTYAAANQCPVIVPFVLGGATAPVSMIAAVTQAYSEVLVGCALAQLVRPGAPVVFGNFVTTVDLKSGSPSFGTPESALASYVAGQLARRVGLPIRCSGAFTSSKMPDGQAMMESVTALHAAVLSGANFVLQSAGWLEGALTMSYEKLVMDADYLGAMHRLLKGLSLDDEAFAMDAFAEVGPGGHFFGCGHTMRNYETAFYDAQLSDTQPFETWFEKGGTDAARRANRKWNEDLMRYEAPPLDEATDESLRDFMERKKATLPDLWH
ncbi:trimethylamine methyltransferase family protein [Tropicibacter sp. Alg240-R139]|uniref:trimethylamine methyltransferase family protein n=1 Tax=Tropicibacter sp. Alg240-R139 TaxID=2305991 RepID=UPI0013DFBB95|nr:trimethylamine methyltransferase family protein [Tropicibacter sp. Alg240-R139]